ERFARGCWPRSYNCAERYPVLVHSGGGNRSCSRTSLVSYSALCCSRLCRSLRPPATPARPMWWAPAHPLAAPRPRRMRRRRAAAVGGGGSVSFNCGGGATIVLTSTKMLLADTTLDGGGVITLSGNNTTRLFFVNGGVHFTLNNITLIKGNSPVGGGAIESVG